jgi:hypothetical protein
MKMVDITKIDSHDWFDHDIEGVEPCCENGKLITMELQFKSGPEAIILNRDDVIALAKVFDITT